MGSWVGGLTPVELDVESVGPSRQSLQNFRCLKLPHPGLLPVSWTPCYGVYVAAISLGRPVRQSQLQRLLSFAADLHMTGQSHIPVADEALASPAVGRQSTLQT